MLQIAVVAINIGREERALFLFFRYLKDSVL